MTVAAVLGVIALFGAIVAWVTWHRGANERQSVQYHQHTLETLRHVADRREQSARPAPELGGAAPRRRRSPRPAASGNQRAAPWARRGAGAPPAPFDSAGPTERQHPGRGSPAPPAPTESAKVDAARRETIVFVDDTPGTSAQTRPAISRSAPRMGGKLLKRVEPPRVRGHDRVRRTRIVAAVAVIAVGGAVAVAVVLAPSHSAPHRSHPPRQVATAGRGRRATTVPPSVVTPTASTASTATYAAPSSHYTIVIGASSVSWVMATEAATGTVVWTGTLAAGESRSLSVTGNLVVQLGAPTDTSVTMDGRAVQFPTSYRAPFDMTFQAAA